VTNAMQRKVKPSAEQRLIARYFRPLASHPGAFGLADDAAAISPPAGYDLVLTTDGVIAGVHVFADEPADFIARRALRMNLSDLAAKGATPLGFLLALSLPAGTKKSWIAAFARGLGEDAKRFGCALLGGDTDHTPGPAAVSIAAFGAVPHGKMVRRSTAKVGDVVVVTGTIGDAALGVKLRRDPRLAKRWRLGKAEADELIRRYRLPQPRNALARAVLRYASAAIDISDGLAGDLDKLCGGSKVAADIDVAGVPFSKAARAALTAEPKLMQTVLTGGDDYEIALTVAPKKLAAFRRAAEAAGVPVTAIGRIQRGAGACFVQEGRALNFARPAYSHF
jgi:thiamine-monophosphate kinase